jgi:hypothetical protein
MKTRKLKTLQSDTSQGINKLIKKYGKKGWNRAYMTAYNVVENYTVIMAKYEEKQ